LNLHLSSTPSEPATRPVVCALAATLLGFALVASPATVVPLSRHRRSATRAVVRWAARPAAPVAGMSGAVEASKRVAAAKVQPTPRCSLAITRVAQQRIRQIVTIRRNGRLGP
jgi:hypothetical protein